MSTGYSSREPGINSQHERGSLQPIVSPVPTSLSRLYRHQAYTRYMNTHAGKTSTHIKINDQNEKKKLL